jgi:hypothetical protein
MGLVGQAAAVVCAKPMGEMASSKVAKIVRRLKRFSMRVSMACIVPKTAEQKTLPPLTPLFHNSK